MKKVKITIEGMHCAACGSNVEQSIKKISGVSKVTVSIMTKRAIVEADDSVSVDQLKSAVTNVGYKVIKIE